MLAIAQVHTPKYVEIAEEPDHTLALVKLEREALGFDHMAVGQRLLAKWNLPKELTSAVGQHHTYLPISPPLNHVLLVANLLTEVLWNPASTYMQPLRYVLNTRLDLDVDDLITLALGSKQLVNESMQIFGVRLPGKIDLEEIEAQARAQFAEAALESEDFLGGLDTLVIQA